MRHEWKPPEALWSGQTLCYVEGPLEDLVLTRHEASERQLAHEILRLAEREKALDSACRGNELVIAGLEARARELEEILSKRGDIRKALPVYDARLAALEEENRRLREERKELALACRGCGETITSKGQVTVSPEAAGTVIYVAPHTCAPSRTTP